MRYIDLDHIESSYFLCSVGQKIRRLLTHTLFYFDAAIINNPVVHTITTAIGGNMFAQTKPIAPPIMKPIFILQQLLIVYFYFAHV